jgi:hypothetical protein
LGLILALGLITPAVAAALTCTAQTDRARVSPGEQILLTISLEGTFQDVAPPVLPSLEGVSVREGGTSRSFTLIDGQRKGSLSFSYVIEVRRDRSFTIPALTLRADGQDYATRPIPIEVVPGAAGGAAPAPGQPSVTATPTRPGSRSRADGSAGGPGDPLFVTLTADRSRAWIGEQVVVAFRFHRRVPLWDAPQYRPPRSEGFWREDLTPERNFAVTVAGARYEVTEIRYALFPTRAGRLIIEPAEVSLPDNPFSRFDRFFGRSNAPELPRLLRTGALALEVMALPEPRPAAFSGMVATRATLAARLSQARVPRGEPLTLTVELQADGFLKGLAGVPLPPLPGIEVHDAGDRFEVDRGGDRLVSHYREEKVLVPQDEGTVHLPPVQFSYFDPTRGRYATAQAEPGDLSVGPGGAARPVALADGADARTAREPAVEHPVPLRPRLRGRALPARPGWWAALLAPPLALGVLGLRRRRERRLARDPAARRRTLALAEARRRLRRTAGGGGDAGALTDLAHAIAGYVGDRTGRPVTAVGAGELRDLAADLGLAEVGEQLARVLRTCDEARFAGRDSSASPATLAAEAERLLMALEHASPKRPRWRVRRPPVALLVVMVCVLGPGTVGAGEAERDAATIARLLSEGVAACVAGDDATAVARYREAVTLGVDDPALHYNLGNAHARRGELGLAVVSYLRARRLAPRDRDVLANLELTLARGRDRDLLPRRLPLGIAQLAALPGSLSVDGWSILSLAFTWICAFLVALRWRRNGAPPVVRRLLRGGLFLLAAAGATTAVRFHQERTGGQAVVVVAEAEVRSGPAVSYPVAFRVHDGLPLTVQDRQEGWRRISLGGAGTGWLPAASVETVRLP